LRDEYLSANIFWGGLTMSAKANSFYVDESSPWFGSQSGWPEQVPKNVEFPLTSLGEMLKNSARKWPECNALWFLDTFMHYRKLDDLVDRLATALDKIGVKKGDVVAMLLPNSYQYVVSFYACMRLGVIASGVNPTYKPQEILHQLKLIGAKTLIVLDVLYEGSIAPVIEQSFVKNVIVTNITDLLGLSPIKKFLGKMLKKIPSAPAPGGAFLYSEMIKAEPNPPKVEVNAEDIATYIMTGGTTGVPKAAVLSHMNCHSNAVQCSKWLYKIEPNNCSIGVLPLFHSFAMTVVMNTPLLMGAWAMLFPKPPETAELVQKILRYCPDDGTLYAGAEILFQRLTEFPGIEDSGVKKKFTLCVSGAGPLHRPVQEAFEAKTGGRLVEGYGLTETSPVVSAHPFWGNRKIGTIGLPFPGTEWRIVDPTDHLKNKAPVPDGETADQEKHIGELAVAGPQVMVGYLGNPTETAETIVEMDGKHWLLTGDIGYMDEQGRVSISDRKKQLIKYKGYSVYPKEIEELVGGHNAVLEVAVAGLPDHETGEKIKAWVVLRPEWRGKLSIEELHDWCRKNMTHYKVPSYLEFIDELPKTLVGKVMRRTLQENDPLFKKYHSA